MEDLFFLLMVGAVVGGIGWAAYHFKLITQPLRKRVTAANPVAGKTQAQLIEMLGPPNARSAQANGKMLLQWMEGGYHIALLFNATGICEGVTHEMSV